MEIHKTTNTGIALKFTKSIVSVNPSQKQKKSLTPTTILNAFSVPIPNWTDVFNGGEEQKIFTGADEYEREGIFIRGFSVDVEIQKQNIYSTLWSVSGDDLKFLILGVIQDKNKIKNALAEIANTDVLIVPCVKEFTLKPVDIGSIVAQLQVKRVILIGDDDEMKKSIGKEIGKIENFTDKISLKKKDLSEQEIKTIILD